MLPIGVFLPTIFYLKMIDNLHEQIKIWFAEDIGDGDHTSLFLHSRNGDGKIAAHHQRKRRFGRC